MTDPAASSSTRVPRIALGLLVIGAAIAVNRYSVAWATTKDGDIESLRNNLVIAAGQLVLAIVGGLICVGRLRAANRPAFRWLLTAGCAVAVAGGTFGTLRSFDFFQGERERTLARAFARATMSEILHGRTTIRLRDLAKGFGAGKLPPQTLLEEFADQVTIVDFASMKPAEPATEHADFGISVVHCRDLAPPRVVARQELDLLRPLFAEVESFENTWFELIDSDFSDATPDRWHATGELRGLARLRDGRYCDPCVRFTVQLQADPGVEEFDGKHFRIHEFRIESCEKQIARTPLFTEELARAVPDAAVVAEARRNLAEEEIVAVLTGKKPTPEKKPWLFTAAMENESVSVVDVDRDGYDDFFFMPRKGRTLLFRNRGNGTFEEASARYGLAYGNGCQAALFADFDNDGDDDVFIGRAFERSLYLEHRDGRFVDQTADRFPDGLPYFVSCIAAADYDNDGLLDVYLGTYAAQLLRPEMERVGPKSDQLLGQYLPPDQARELRRLYLTVQTSNVADRYGVPNQLIRNAGGGRFAPVMDSAANVYRNTFQGAFADYDLDGDQDLYVSNDFGPNQLLRNDGGKFVEVSAATGTTDVGFGMGASWGDYDRDGDLDLYVSNIYSRIGKRLVARIPFIDPILVGMAQGNSLLRQDAGGRFTRVPSACEAAGWSWSGMFQDVNNDGWSDLFVPCSYYTAPKEIASPIELDSDFWRSVIRNDRRLGFQKRFEKNLSNFGEDSPRDSFCGPERDHLFWNRDGVYGEWRGIAGLDHPGDSRTCSQLDYDRDGWLDFVVSSANAPSLLLWRSRIGELRSAAPAPPPMIAVELFGANRSGVAAPGKSARDAIGARLTCSVGNARIVKEHECGEGRASQNSRRIHLGIGGTKVDSLEVRWPAGGVVRYGPFDAGSLIKIYEDPTERPSGAVDVEPYVATAAGTTGQ